MPGPSDPTTATGERATALLEDVREILTEIIGEDEMFGVDVELDSSLAEDIELESIEFVALAEKITERYGEQVDLIDWLAAKELEELIALTVGQIVDFLVTAGA